MIQDFIEENLGKIFCITAVLIILVVIFLIIKGDREWQRFKVEHKCKIVSKEDSTIGTGIGSNGQVITTVESGKTGWLCDDGITYYK